MTREEAVTVLKAFMENPLFSDAHKQAFSIAIHDIKQRHDWDINKLMLVPKTECEQEPKILALLEKTYADFCSCEGGEGWLKIDGKEYATDTGYAIEGVEIFMEVFKRRLAESEE